MSFGSKEYVPLGDFAPAPWLNKEALAPFEGMEPLPFSRSEYDRRHQALANELDRLDAAAAVVFRPASVDWLTGFHSTAQIPMPAIVDRDSVALVVPDVETSRAVVASCAERIFYCHPRADRVRLAVQRLRSELGPGARVVVDIGDPYTPANLLGVAEAEGLVPVDGKGLADRHRLILSTEEITVMEEAAVRTAAGWDAAVRAIHEGADEDSEVAAAIVGALVNGSNSLVRGEVVVATGWRGGVTHSNWNRHKFKPGTSTYLEFTGACHFYVAPIMRTVMHGRVSGRLMRLAELSQLAVSATLDRLAPGVPACEIATAVTKELGDLEDWIVWHYNYGYPVGLAHGRTWMDGAEFYLRDDNPAPVQAGMAFHIPGSMRSFGEAAVGLSHTVVVEETGCRVLTEGLGPLEPLWV